MELTRVRVAFEDRHVLSRSQRREGLKRCWVLLRPELGTVAALASHLVQSFGLQASCPGGVVLSMDGFVLPPFESADIFKDKDIIGLRKKGGTLTEVIKIKEDANRIKDSEVVEKQPLLLCDKVLAVEEFEKESGGYESEDEEEARDQPEEAISTEDLLSREATSKRKRDSDKPQGSKRKKTKLNSLEKYPVVPTEGAENIDLEQNENHPLKGGSSQENPSRKGKSLNEDGTSDRIDGVGKNLVDSATGEKRCEEVQESCKKIINDPNVNGGLKQFPSRSARRKKAKRQWLREHANSYHKNLTQSDIPGVEKNQMSVKCQTDQNNGGEEVVPLVVRPGHIRFGPLEQSERLPHNALETIQWNGTTSKKGQKWGREGNFICGTTVDNVVHEQSKEMLTAEEGHLAAHIIEFEKLPPLAGLPKEGDVVAYRLVELSSSSWCPEISSFRVGKVASYDPVSMKIILMPVSDYPVISNENKDGEESMPQPGLSLYKEDGSLEIEFPSLVDVRTFNVDKSSTTIAVATGGESTDKSTPTGNWKPGFSSRANNKPNRNFFSGARANNKPNNNFFSGARPYNRPNKNFCPGPRFNNTLNKNFPSSSRANNRPDTNISPPAETNQHGGWNETSRASDGKKTGGWEEISRALEEKKVELSEQDGWRSWDTKQNVPPTSWFFGVPRRSIMGPKPSHFRAKNNNPGKGFSKSWNNQGKGFSKS